MRASDGSPPPRWELHAPPPGTVTAALSAALGLHPLVCDILARRGLDDPEAARRFLDAPLDHPHDPYLLLGMEAAVARIVAALEQGERIVISGDYDVDGITSTALLLHFLRAAGCTSAASFIPNRFDHGYGLTGRAVDALLALKPALVITVDNGITAVEETARLHAAGVETIITDHHLPRRAGVPAGIVVNPRQEGCAYPFKGISGCGVTFKLVTALRKALRDEGWWDAGRPEPNLKEYLDLVAIGTVADVVPLEDENRVFVRHGLDVLNRPARRPGIAALASVARINRAIDAQTIAFRLAPRINAAGRMADGGLAVELLLATDPSQAQALAWRLDEENTKRRAREGEMVKEAVEQVTAGGLAAQAGIVVASPDFHEGIIGIVAARLVDRFHRPAVVLAPNGDGLKGSARSIPGVNVTEAFAECANLFQEYGGHAGAAGCKLAADNLAAFQRAFPAACEGLAGADAAPVEWVEGELTPELLVDDLVEQMTRLAPFGHGNAEPTFLLEGRHLTQAPFVLAERHLKWQVAPGVEMIAWDTAKSHEPHARHTYRVTLGFNHFRGRRTIQLTVADIREA